VRTFAVNAGFLSSYVPPPSRYDEMVVPGRKPRPHWQAFLNLLQALPHETLHQRTQFVHAAIASDGV
jgi:uncharacterized circularly permuted ATP-grasp superfamily protein